MHFWFPSADAVSAADGDGKRMNFGLVFLHAGNS